MYTKTCFSSSHFYLRQSTTQVYGLTIVVLLLLIICPIQVQGWSGCFNRCQEREARKKSWLRQSVDLLERLAWRSGCAAGANEVCKWYFAPIWQAPAARGLSVRAGAIQYICWIVTQWFIKNSDFDECLLLKSPLKELFENLIFYSKGVDSPIIISQWNCVIMIY